MSNVIVHHDSLQPLRCLDIASFILIWIVLREGHDEGGNRERDAHIWVVQQRYYPFGPFLLHNVRKLPVKSQKCERGFLLDEWLGRAVAVSVQPLAARGYYVR